MTQKQAERSVTQGWLAGVILSLTIGLENLFYSTGMWWKFIVILLLTVGIYKKSRLAALILFGYFLGEQILSYQNLMQTPFNILFAVLIGIGLLKGLIGVYKYHKLSETAETNIF